MSQRQARERREAANPAVAVTAEPLMTEQDAEYLQFVEDENFSLPADVRTRILATYHAHARLVAENAELREQISNEQGALVDALTDVKMLRAQLAEARAENVELREKRDADRQYIISVATSCVLGGYSGNGSIADAVAWVCAQLAEAQKDVARLEWLRANEHANVPIGAHSLWVEITHTFVNLRAAIDAAMQEGQKNG